MASLYTSLLQRNLDLAAGTPVDPNAYQAWGINLSKLHKLGQCYREGWLHNVLGRITPITTQEMDDYRMMADLFITTSSDARYLCAVLNRSLSTFAVVAGVNATAKVVPIQLENHVKLYRDIAAGLQVRFAFRAPEPFTASATISREVQNRIPYIRDFMTQRFKQA
jgi:hypothetical protein